MAEERQILHSDKDLPVQHHQKLNQTNTPVVPVVPSTETEGRMNPQRKVSGTHQVRLVENCIPHDHAVKILRHDFQNDF
jgi:hypothetical protein